MLGSICDGFRCRICNLLLVGFAVLLFHLVHNFLAKKLSGLTEKGVVDLVWAPYVNAAIGSSPSASIYRMGDCTVHKPFVSRGRPVRCWTYCRGACRSRACSTPLRRYPMNSLQQSAYHGQTDCRGGCPEWLA